MDLAAAVPVAALAVAAPAEDEALVAVPAAASEALAAIVRAVLAAGLAADFMAAVFTAAFGPRRRYILWEGAGAEVQVVCPR